MITNETVNLLLHHAANKPLYAVYSDRLLVQMIPVTMPVHSAGVYFKKYIFYFVHLKEQFCPQQE